MTSKDIREKYINFFVSRGHKQIAPAKLVPENDPTTLFTSSGMQPLIPYLLGQTHPEGKRLVNSQPCFRAEDIEEVGDNRHTTFFEMLGNWSMGGYFKKEQLSWFWEFLTKELGLPKEKLYVSVFEGNKEVPKDTESLEIWQSLGIGEDHIFFYGVDKNWWSRSGPPDKMPAGEIGGPDSEVFYEFDSVEHNKKYGEKCHPNCECGHFLEIGNSVFIQYQKQPDGSLKELTQKNVDFGGGLERLTAAVNNNPDIFQIDIFEGLRDEIINKSTNIMNDTGNSRVRIFLDHSRAAIFLIAAGVQPGNKEREYVVRRLVRRANDQLTFLFKDYIHTEAILWWERTVNYFKQVYNGVYQLDEKEVIKKIRVELGKYGEVVSSSNEQFVQNLITLDKDRNENLIAGQVYKYLGENDPKRFISSHAFTSLPSVATGTIAFEAQSSRGFPYERTFQVAEQKLGRELKLEEAKGVLEIFKEKHRELSRTASAGMFKGGLADHSEIVIKYHTATHLLHQSLRDILGSQVFQKGSNITAERLRFDFSFNRKMTDEEIKQVEDLVNNKIKEDLKVDHMIIPLDQAKQMNAIGLFNEKYTEKVSIYGVGPKYQLDPDAKDTRDRGGYYSLEFCGGPHVEHTGVIGKINITKEEAISSGIRRIRAEIVLR